MKNEADLNKVLASVLVIFLIGVLLVALFPFSKGLFGALLLYVIFKKLYLKLEKTLPSGLSAFLIILLSLLVVLIPLFLIISSVVAKLPDVVELSKGAIQKLDFIKELFPSLDTETLLLDFAGKAGEFAQGLLIGAVGGVATLTLSLIIMYFVLYYMLTNNKKMGKLAQSIIPFNKKNTDALMKEFTNVTNSTIISTGIIAVLQGVLLGIGFAIFGISNAFFWTMIGVFLSFIPLVGVALLWIPAAVISFALGNVGSGFGLLIWGLVLSNIDNFMRPALQKKIGEVHPLTSFIGVIVGIPLFGILGLILGPLLISYVFLTIKMYKQEYLKK